MRAQVRPSPVLLLLLALAVGACGQAARSGPVVGSEPTRVRVENQSSSQVNIYVVAGAQRIRLGSVVGSATAVLRIPDSVVGFGRDLSFLADPIGSSNVASSFSIYVQPGEEVTITIPSRVR